MFDKNVVELNISYVLTQPHWNHELFYFKEEKKKQEKGRKRHTKKTLLTADW